jgi:deoxyadenosine/deoxycytidine kinase
VSWPPPVGPISTQAHFQANGLVFGGKVKATFDSECDKESEGVNTAYRYYVTGSVGTGKTTLVEQIRSIECFDEWVDRKTPLLHKPHEELSGTERTEVDTWINHQFRKKNRRITNVSQSLVLIDRSPMDPLYFTKDQHAAKKRASELLDGMVPPLSQIKRIAPGHLIILTCDTAVLKSRLAMREKQYSQEQLKVMENTIIEFWKNYLSVTIIDTTNMSVSQVVKRVLQVLLFDEYSEIEFQDVCNAKKLQAT